MWIFSLQCGDRIAHQFVAIEEAIRSINSIRTDSNPLCSYFCSIYHWIQYSIDWFWRPFHQIEFDGSRIYWIREVEAQRSIRFRFCPFPVFFLSSHLHHPSIQQCQNENGSAPVQCSVVVGVTTYRFSLLDIIRPVFNSSAGYFYGRKTPRSKKSARI